jgi:hypothetical protein
MATQDALKNLRKEIDGGITKAGSGSYMVRRCCEDWFTSGGLPGRDPKTVAKNKYVLEPPLTVIGNARLRDLVRGGDPDEIVGAALYFASEASCLPPALSLAWTQGTRCVAWKSGIILLTQLACLHLLRGCGDKRT